MRYLILITVLLFGCEPLPKVKTETNTTVKDVSSKVSEICVKGVVYYVSTGGHWGAVKIRPDGSIEQCGER